MRILNIFRDLIIRYLPFKVSRKYKFAFLVHPRDISDVYKKFPFAEKIPKCLVFFYCKHAWPIVVSKITGLKSQKTGKYIKGLVISIPMTAKQIIEDRIKAKKKIIQAIKMSEKLGVELVGLGALTSSVTRGGLDLVGKVKAGVTTGHTYTSYIVTQNIFKALKVLNISINKAVVAIVGAAGSIGSTSAKILAEQGIKRLILVDLEKKNKRLNRLKQYLSKKYPLLKLIVTHRIHDVYQSDAVIAATNAPEALIKSKDLRLGTIIVDDAQPSDLSKEIFNRKDLLAVEGGVIHAPEIFTHFNFGLANKQDSFSCLGELLVLSSMHWKRNYNLGWVNLERLKNIIKNSKPLNFELGVFQNCKKVYNKRDIEFIKKSKKLYVF